jgi:hypothetical protein
MMNLRPWKKRNFILLFLLLLLSRLGAPGGNGAVRLQENPPSWTFAVISDTQGDNKEIAGKSCINDAVLRALAEDIVREHPDFVLVAGDLVNGWFKNGGTDYAVQYVHWKEAMRPVYAAGIRVYPIRGNHNDGPERLALPPLPANLEPPPGTPERMKIAFREAFPESYIPRNGPAGEEGLTYSFGHKNAFIIGLDQYTGGQHKVNQGWLDRQLAENKNPHVFVYGHEPAFETNHKDNLAFFSKERDLFWNSLGKAGGRVYFCGHDHFYNRALIPDSAGNEIRQIIVGTGGGTLKAWAGKYADPRVRGEFHDGDHSGYVLVTVEEKKATIRWKGFPKTDGPVAWSVLDSFSYALPDKRN